MTDRFPSVVARIIPWEKDKATSALEAGADALWVPDGCSAEAKSLARVTTVSSDGDLKPGVDVRIVEMRSRADEDLVRTGPDDVLWLVRPSSNEIIPLENLVAWKKKIIVEARSVDEVALYRGILEVGVHGLVLSADTHAAMRALVEAAVAGNEAVGLVIATVVSVEPLGTGDRVCVDTCSLVEGAKGMLVGNSSAGLFLVCAENVENPYVAARPFRVNAGAVHSYTLLPGGRTGYLSELAAGGSVLLVDAEGRAEGAVVGRAKIERRPLLMVTAESASGAVHSVVLQNAETIRLVGPGGGAVSVAVVSPGDKVLVREEKAGRHFGVAVDETIREK